MSTFLIPPENSSYSLAQNVESLSEELDGGAPKIRRDIIGAAFKVDVSWIFNPEEYEYARAFYRTATDHGSLPFDIGLIIDEPSLVIYEARFVPGTWRLNSQKGLSYSVSAQLSVVVPVNPDEATDDAAIISAYEAAHS